jgi:hypothetical protein
MIKHINHQNFSTTPFVAAKSWDLYNIQNDDIVLLETSSSNQTEFGVSMDYLDYTSGTPTLNRSCNIALENQDADMLSFQEGITGSGMFDSASAERNVDGTYKALVHNQIKNAFYNRRNNPTQIFGTEYIDLPLGRTERFLSDYFRMFTIPREVFGEKIQPLSVRFTDNNLDDNVTIQDDGYQNLTAGADLFSKVQEVRAFRYPTGSNLILDGFISNSCAIYDDTIVTASASDAMGISPGFYYGLTQEEQRMDTGSVTMGFYSASLTDHPLTSSATVGLGFAYASLNTRTETDSTAIGVGFSSGLLFSSTVTSSAPDTASMEITFYSGSLFDTVVSGSASDTGSLTVVFYSGSLDDIIVQAVGADTGSIFMGYSTGYIADVAMPSTNTEYQTMSISFLNGTSSVVVGGTGYATASNGSIVPKPS